MSTVNLFLTLLLLKCWHTKAAEIPCEEFQNNWCYMDKTTSVDLKDLAVSNPRDDNVLGMYFSFNPKISFLPVRVYQKFPNLVNFHARQCSISEISKQNFERLNQLEGLYLSGNRIEKIASNAFADLGKIKKIELNNNRIKFLKNELFEGKPDLGFIGLRDNVCVDGQFAGQTEFAVLQSTLREKCAFNDDEGLVPEYTCGIVPNKGEVEETTQRRARVANIRRMKGGTVTERGQWPFLVALTLNSTGQFFCGGNLISSRHVLTAAHCLHDKNQIKQLEPTDLALLVGSHDLRSSERGSEKLAVKQIFMHHEWSNQTDKYEGDIAILVLDQPVKFSEFVQPVCLTNHAEMLSNFDGTVVGWGKAESGDAHENLSRQVKISAVTTEACFAKDHNLGAIYSEKSFCAGGGGVGPCTGDSGGGFFVDFKGRWTLKGIASAGSRGIGGDCNVDRFSLFTRLADFTDWITDHVKRS